MKRQRRQCKQELRLLTNSLDMLKHFQFTYHLDLAPLSHLSPISVLPLLFLVYGGAPKRKQRNSDKTWYPAEDEKKIFKRKRNQPKPSTGRKSITPGTIVILLSGPHRGRRAVALKSLPSGNILVTGPYAVNGVPLKRVNPAYVIATSTKVPLDGVTANVDETHFKRQVRYTKNELKNASEARTKRSEAGKQAVTSWKT